MNKCTQFNFTTVRYSCLGHRMKISRSHNRSASMLHMLIGLLRHVKIICPVSTLTTKLPNSLGTLTLGNNTRAVGLELHVMDFHGRAGILKMKFTMHNGSCKWSGVKHTAIGRWSCRNMLSCWSDESCFTIWRFDGWLLVWKMPGERYLPECIVVTIKFGGGGVFLGGARLISFT